MLTRRACPCQSSSNNQFTAELGLALDLPLHPCHTEDPNEADAFIVPVQVGRECLIERTRS